MVSPCPMCNRWFPLKDWYQYLLKSRQTVITLFWISFLQYNIWTRKLHSGIYNNLIEKRSLSSSLLWWELITLFEIPWFQAGGWGFQCHQLQCLQKYFSWEKLWPFNTKCFWSDMFNSLIGVIELQKGRKGLKGNFDVQRWIYYCVSSQPHMD